MDLFAMVSATAVLDKITQRGHNTIGSSTDFNELLKLEESIPEVCDIAIKLTEAPQVDSGTYTVILDPALGGIFVHEAFGHTAEADGIVDSEQLMEVMKVGTKIGSDKLTIFDSGLFPGSRGYLPFDDEGVESQKTYLIKNGVVSGHLHSRLTAAKMGVNSSGSARAIDFRYPPIVRMRTTCIEGGNDTLEDMLKGVKSGLYCVKSNGGTGGEMFTFTTAYAYLIEDGRITTLVRDVKLSGNLFVTLKNIDMVGNDFTVYEMGGGCGKAGQFPLPVATGSPHIRIQDVVVGGA
jgi:TldD protein